MAVLTLGNEVQWKWHDDAVARFAVYELLGVSTNDTIDMSPDFRVVKRATLMGITVAAQASATLSGNVITIPPGVTLDGAYLTVYGVHR